MPDYGSRDGRQSGWLRRRYHLSGAAHRHCAGKGETQQLNIEYGTDDKAEQEKIAEAASKLNLTWTSSDEEVATVDETGLVTAVGAGEADVTVSVADANISSTTHVKVVITPTGVEAPDSIELVTNGENSKALGAK